MWNWIGIAIAGMLNGTFAVPMKKARVWTFHHVWGLFSVLAMVVVPWTGILLAVPSWRGTLMAIPAGGLTSLIALGLIWGAASLLYGLAIDYLGVALGISIQLGLSIVVGSLLPLLSADTTELDWGHSLLFLGSLLVMVVGVVVCALAGEDSSIHTDAKRPRFRTGLLIAIMGGLGGPLLNIGIQYGINLLERVEKSAPEQQWVAWAVFLSAAAVTQSGYCLARTLKERNVNVYWSNRAPRDAALVVMMSLIWAGSIYCYASSSAALGRLGTSFGWPIFIGLIVVTSNTWGVLLGEWQDRPPSRLHWMLLGSAILIVGVFLIAQSRP